MIYVQWHADNSIVYFEDDVETIANSARSGIEPADILIDEEISGY
jgi:hypothetical protein